MGAKAADTPASVYLQADIDRIYTAACSNKNAALIFAPIPERAARVPMAIPVTIKPYSMAVAARSSLRKAVA
jgi:hypothetical protein